MKVEKSIEFSVEISYYIKYAQDHLIFFKFCLILFDGPSFLSFLFLDPV